MKPKIREKLIAALESGGYRHGRRVMRRGNRFCVLGVLCDLHADRTGRDWEKGGRVFCYMERHGEAPDLVRRWAGLDFVEQQKLINLNDGTTNYSLVIEYLKEARNEA